MTEKTISKKNVIARSPERATGRRGNLKDIHRSIHLLANRLIQFPSRERIKVFFITGTDTGIGKTFLTCALLKEFQRRGIRAVGFKPICCGDREDALKFWNLAKRQIPIDVINPIHLKQPVAPVAQRCPSWSILRRRILKAFSQYQFFGFQIVLVEGAGGLLCPITKKHTMADLAKALNLPMIMVAYDRLGVLNQSLLVYEAAKSRRLTCAAGVLSGLRRCKDDVSRKSNQRCLSRLIPIPFYRIYLRKTLSVQNHCKRNSSFVSCPHGLLPLRLGGRREKRM